MNVATLNINGIKCDNLSCSYKNENVSLDSYEQWLNIPCPYCGENLLTQADFDSVKLLHFTVNSANENGPANNVDEPILHASLSMCGTGSFEIMNIALT